MTDETGARDARIGYRWQLDPPAKDPVRDFEVLPMPPDPVANWPDYEDPSRRRP